MGRTLNSERYPLFTAIYFEYSKPAGLNFIFMESTMQVGLLTITIHLHAIGSLKDKRKIVKSLIERLRSRFNCATAEIEAQDSKLIARIGLAVVSNDGHLVNRQLDLIAEYVRQDGRFLVGRISREIFAVNDDYPLE